LEGKKEKGRSIIRGEKRLSMPILALRTGRASVIRREKRVDKMSGYRGNSAAEEFQSPEEGNP